LYNINAGEQGETAYRKSGSGRKHTGNFQRPRRSFLHL